MLTTRRYRQIVDRFNLKKALADDKTVSKLRMAGYRGNAPLVVFLFARLVLPLIFFVVAMFYLFAVNKLQQPAITKIQGAIAQNRIPANSIKARAKLFGESIALVQIGW